MANLPSIKDFITIEQTHAYTAGTNPLSQSMGSACNWIQDNITKTPVGSVIQSMLTEAQFQAVYGSGWVLCDGRSVAGSFFQSITGNSNIPDNRSLYLRGKKNGRSDGKGRGTDFALGTDVSDENDIHLHSVNVTKNEVSNSNGTLDTDTDKDYFGPNANFNGNITIGNSITSGLQGNEMRPETVTVNDF